MKKRHYVITSKDLYDPELWPHLIDRLPNGINGHVNCNSEKDAVEIASSIIEDYMKMACDEMINTGDIWGIPCLKTGYIYIKDQKLHYDEDYYKYDIDLNGAFYLPVFILDRSIMNKACGYYRLLLPLRKLKKIKNNAKKGIIYNGSTGK